MVRAVPGMVIQILENLIVNAGYWLREQKRYESDFSPTLTVSIDARRQNPDGPRQRPGGDRRKERADLPAIRDLQALRGSGGGWASTFHARMAEYHGWKLYMDDDVGRVREGRLNSFVLDMG